VFPATSSPLLARPGAVAAHGVDAGVAGHYGDPLAEQRLVLTDAPAIVDRSHRGVVAVSGPDRLTWLHSLLSQHLSDLPAGQARQALLLSPHGHVEQHVIVADDGATVLIDTEPGRAAEFAAYLDSMRFMLRVDVADMTDDLAVVTIVNAANVPDRPPGARSLPWGADVLVPRPQIVETLDSLALPLVGHDAFEAVRVAGHRPRLGFETDHRTIPHEIGWIGTAVHLDKGCYRGQETVARVQNLGRPPRRLVLLHLDGSREHLPGPGASVTDGERSVGFLGTAVWHAELGQIALALVKRQVPLDARLTVGGVAAAIDPE
jgi:folate-binding protein YgfZ